MSIFHATKIKAVEILRYIIDKRYKNYLCVCVCVERHQHRENFLTNPLLRSELQSYFGTNRI